MNSEQKSSHLLKEALARFPGVTEADLEKYTPQAKAVIDAIDSRARSLAVQTGDDSWIEIGRAFYNRALKSKPAPHYKRKMVELPY